ncbi:MAG: helix-turn-helix transcriptional regulator [Lachnospiraceae bacterium]|nr:helix-turn-helix transcriptional regulator [Lachnospiraceae bacterium]
MSMLSNEFLNQQTTLAFTGTYLALLTLGVIGLFMIFIAMKVTYLPLRRLTQRIASDVPECTSHLERLENTFLEVSNKNQAIQKKLDAYRSFMHESLINSFVSSKQNEGNALLDMDVFLDGDSEKEILIIYMSASGGEFNSHDYVEILKSTFVCVKQCVTLETKTDSAVFLVVCIDETVNMEEKILGLQQQFWQEQGWMSAVSRSSDSLLDIPSLYESVMRGSKFWPQIAVVDCRKQEKAQGISCYPHDKLDDLAAAFAESDFSAARELVVELFELVGSYSDKDESIQNYLIPCILIDMLTSIANSMSQARIALVSYDNLYYETLYLCRSCYSLDNVTAIAVNVEKLLDIYEQECMEKMINTAMVRQVIEECCYQPEFSITVLADKFHVSVGYMSYMFKTEFNITFSDYLWELRLKKTKELLLSTEMSVEEISESVGYYSVSGFRRKFKKETGMTPSQFRENEGRE